MSLLNPAPPIKPLRTRVKPFFFSCSGCWLLPPPLSPLLFPRHFKRIICEEDRKELGETESCGGISKFHSALLSRPCWNTFLEVFWCIRIWGSKKSLGRFLPPVWSGKKGSWVVSRQQITAFKTTNLSRCWGCVGRAEKNRSYTGEKESWLGEKINVSSCWCTIFTDLHLKTASWHVAPHFIAPS